MIDFSRTLRGVVAAAAALAAGPTWADEPIVVKAGRIITVSGEDLEGGMIIIRDGRIVAVGRDLQVPWDAKIIDASDRVVMPGWIEAHSWRGTDRANEQMPSVPYVSTFDSINPADPHFEDSLRQGITALFVLPGNSTMIGGQGCLVRSSGTTTEQMTLIRNHGLKVSLEPRQGSRMSHLAALRREFDSLVEYLKEIEERRKEVPASARTPKEPAPEVEAKKEVMARLLSGKTTAYVYCPESPDVLRAIELAKKYGFRMKLILGRNTWKAAPIIAAEKLEVVLPPDMIFWETDRTEHREVLRVLPKIFHEAGVRFSFQTDPGSLGTSYHWYHAAAAVKHGLPRDVALKAATIHAAEFAGVGDRLGSIEKGKWAHLQILTGDPLDVRTWVDQVLIDGAVVYERSKDERLKRVMDSGSKK